MESKSIDSVLNKILSYSLMSTETIGIEYANNRTITKPIVSSEQIPPFNKSAMDGYACKYEDLKNDLKCIGTIQAGSFFNGLISDGECVKIMTGAPVPDGLDVVFKSEDSIIVNSRIRCVNHKTSKNICYIGEDISINQEVIESNTFLEPHHIAIMASLGIENVEVYKNYIVGIIATGTELVEYNSNPLPWQIRNSNSQLFKNRIPSAKYYGIVTDEKKAITDAIINAFSEVDVLLITGGASDSDFDLVPSIIQELGFSVEVRKVAMQPGKPFLFAHKNGKFCFGLSGNPVSSFVQFLLFVQPFLRIDSKVEFQLPLLEDFTRKKAERDLFIPIKITKNGVELIKYNGSAHISAFSQAHAIAKVPQGITTLNKGDLVDVRQL